VYDIKAPLSGAKPVVPVRAGGGVDHEGMAPMGEEYVSVLRKGCLEQRWVDRSRNKGKREGAFSSGSHGTHPFIMMSYADDLFSLSTLAHELGHSLHSYYTRRTSRSSTAATRCSWPRSRRTSTRRWCATTSSARRPAAISRSA
jgi:oligoendopeptidase F